MGKLVQLGVQLGLLRAKQLFSFGNQMCEFVYELLMGSIGIGHTHKIG